MSVRRYSMELRTMMGDSWQDLVRDDDGEWMRYEDHLDVAQMYRDEFKLRLAAEQRNTALVAAANDIENHPNAIFNVGACAPGAPTIRDLVRAVLPPAEREAK